MVGLVSNFGVLYWEIVCGTFTFGSKFLWGSTQFGTGGLLWSESYGLLILTFLSSSSGVTKD